ncbi:MAG: DASS family sodium-coupled anion symporter [Phycisphaerae bacterium]|nr:DASS family sodium-coupled anion symporter [Phycisphaerae bacterium]
MHLARYATLAGALVVVVVLLLGPAWVVPIHPDTGLPYHQLKDHPTYAACYVPERAPQSALAVFVLCLALWLTNLIPLASTGLLAIALLPLLGIVEPKQAFAYFGNSAVFFIIGVFLLAAAMIRTGLSKRLTLMLLKRFDRRPALLVAGVTCSAAFLALWMPEHAVAAMMFPIVLEIADCLGLEKGRSGYAKALFFGLAWGAVIGGCGTFLGGARAPLAVELLRDTFRKASGEPEYSISFIAWMKVSMPLVVVMTALGVLVLRYCIRSEVTDITRATKMLNQRVSALGPMSSRERRLAIVAVLTILCWIFVGHRIDIAVIAIASAVALSALGIVRWQETQAYVNWGVVVMYGGAVALGASLQDTHAMLCLVQYVIPKGEIDPTLLLILMAALSIALSAGISNAAAVAALLPVGFALCEATTPHVHPMAMTYAVAIASGLAFVLPISSPPHAICFASGYYGMKEVPKYGVLLTVLALAVMIGLMVFYWPAIGLPITLP